MPVVLTYYLETPCNPHKPFCRTCVNTFKLATCRSQCTLGPTIICLTPTIDGGTTVCAVCKDEEVASKYYVVITPSGGLTYYSSNWVMIVGAGACGGTVFYGNYDEVNNVYNQGCFFDSSDSTAQNFQLVLDLGGGRIIVTCLVHLTFTVYLIQTDIRTGLGCLQPLVFVNSSSGHTITLYPITTNLP